MLLFRCPECGGQMASFEGAPEADCPRCGAKTTADSGLRITITLGHEDFEELGDEQDLPREDLVRI